MCTQSCLTLFDPLDRSLPSSSVPFLPPGDFPDPDIDPVSSVAPALAGRFFTTEPPEKSLRVLDTSYMRNHTLVVLLCLAYFT